MLISLLHIPFLPYIGTLSDKEKPCMNVDEDVIKESIGHMHKTILMLTVCFPLFLDDVGENIEIHI